MKYYLSVVVAARNDNYGGDFEERLQNCITWFDGYANRYGLKAEFIIVNYNPVEERPSLLEAVTFPKASNVDYRIITVPKAFHEKVSMDGLKRKIPMYEYIAKNIGIRRATGEYILAGNPDILLDPSILNYIARQKLQSDHYYRVDRCDYKAIGKAVTMDDLEEVRKRIFVIHTRGYDFEIKSQPFFFLKLLWAKIKTALISGKKAYEARYHQRSSAYPMPYRIHTNGGGDFLLMHRNSWYKIHGNPENTFLPVHTDSIAVAMAKFSGLKEFVFFYPAYHQDHGRRFSSGQADEEVEKMYRQFLEDANWMEQNKQAKIYNTETWGFSNETFEEILVKEN
ncbi:MAG: hypothetical protein JWO06_1704 [Bacteroidota bacterium]|nr:hypothetical protein [Bacteroidota bacterium]